MAIYSEFSHWKWWFTGGYTHVIILGFTDVFFFNPRLWGRVRPSQGSVSPIRIRISGSNIRVAKTTHTSQWSNSLAAGGDLPNSIRSFCCSTKTMREKLTGEMVLVFIHIRRFPAMAVPQNGWFIIYNRKSYLNACFGGTAIWGNLHF